jgi:Tfp pilus assembly protein FimV
LLAISLGHALGLGDIRSSSFLGQPLEARIEVIMEGHDYAPEEIKVRQINAAQASDLGIDLAGYQPNYRLKPTISAGRLMVSLTSQQPIREPFLNLLIELKWPEGTVYREYTLLLDPVTSAQISMPTAASTAISKVKASKEKTQSVNRQASSKQPPPDFNKGDSQYRVRSGDNLSKIASRLVAGSDVRRSDMMQWLLENNPRAFTNGEMNRLLAGAVLALPENTDVSSVITPPRSKPLSVDKKADTSLPVTSQLPQPANNQALAQRLTIVTPNANNASNAKGTVPASKQLESLQTQLAVTNEVIDRLQRDNQAMRNRLVEIEKSGYVNSLERLVRLKEEEVSNLRATLSNNSEQGIDVANDLKETVELDEATASEVISTEAETANAKTLQRLWLAVLVLLAAVTGMVFFFLRGSSRISADDASADKSSSKEDELLQELDDIIDARNDFDVNHKSHTKEADHNNDAFNIIEQGAHRYDRRPDDVVKKSIQAKTQGYSQPESAEQEKNYHDEVDELISDAIEAANRGAFDVAEALLVAERTHQARTPSGDRGDIDSRLELAMEFVEQLRQSN